MNLNDAAEALNRVSAPTVSIDLSAWFGDGFRVDWARPSVAEFYRVAADAGKIKEKYPIFPVELCLEVAKMAAFHQFPSPGGMPVALFYAEIASKSPECWYYLSVSFRETFPEYQEMGAAELKNLLRARVTATPSPDYAPDSPLAPAALPGEDTLSN